MNADDLIDSYVSDVVAQLPRRQRDDVAAELRSLLHDELAERAAAPGADRDALARDLLNGFGHPNEVVLRYRPARPLIDPVDTRRAVRTSVIGVAVIWAVGLARVLWPPVPYDHWLLAVRDWWLGAALPALWWPGVVGVCFAGTAWVRRRFADRLAWQPRPPATDAVNRGGRFTAAAFAVAGTALMLWFPQFLDLVSGGRVAQSALDAFVYDPGFLRVRGPVLLAAVVSSIALLVAVGVRGRWERATRRLSLGLTVFMGAAMAWSALAGPVFVAAPTDEIMKLALVVLTLVVVIDGYQQLRRLRKPGRTVPAH
ncbi:hypothetical protein Cs7R123_48800 [Catellatospora sp. TT07R-123]|uniref:hypothetical protein n=1 Tax=Catellatospora sp. TT07R-123 TaxID=2733863 RepID=UPI001B208DAA|nr:hypothetical protein [Catellatospora sp. TT07R-123]GHJ47538.1 hypothetical protein Cs7R123_48800 [Catellatospora sp. TT07R-123]